MKVTRMSPLVEAKLEAISDRIIAEIIERFPTNIKIYEIQNIVEHKLLAANEYAIAKNTLIIVLSVTLHVHKQQISIFY